MGKDKWVAGEKYSILYYWQHGSTGPASKKPQPKIDPIYKKPQTEDADPYILPITTTPSSNPF